MSARTRNAQVTPTGFLRWVFRTLPAQPPKANFAAEGTTFHDDLAKATTQAADGTRSQWVLEMLFYEMDGRGQVCGQAWLPVPMLTAEQATAEDRERGMNRAGLIIPGRL